MSGDSGRECRTGALATRRRSARDRCACPQGSGQRQAQDSRECLRPGAADRSLRTRPNGRSGSFLLTACQQGPPLSSPLAGLEAALSTCEHQSASQRQRASLRRGRLRVATDPASAGIRLWSGQMPGCSTPPTKGPHFARTHSTHSKGPFALNPTRRPVTATALNESQEFVGSGRVGLPKRLRLELSADVPPLNGQRNETIAAGPAHDPGEFITIVALQQLFVG